MTQTYLTTEALPVLHPEYDARTIPSQLDDSVLCGSIHYLGESRYQVSEDKGCYIPDVLSVAHYDANPQAYSAAEDYAKHLRKAERLLDDALNLVGLMLAAIGDESDSRAMQTEAGLKAVEKKLRKVSNRIDKHDTRHTNIFLAYFDLKHKADRGEQD